MCTEQKVHLNNCLTHIESVKPFFFVKFIFTTKFFIFFKSNISVLLFDQTNQIKLKTVFNDDICPIKLFLKRVKLGGMLMLRVSMCSQRLIKNEGSFSSVIYRPVTHLLIRSVSQSVIFCENIFKKTLLQNRKS